MLSGGKRARLRLDGVPVLLYHGLTAAGMPDVPRREQKYWVPATQFRDHLDHIRARGHEVRLLDELWTSPDTVDRGARCAVITVDDGNASDHRLALPALVERDMRAEFFINTATIDSDGYLTWRDVGEMQRAGMSFQSHSHDHVDLARLPLRTLEHQLGDSKRLLEDRLGCTVNFLAAPYGRLNKQVVEVAHQVGYQVVCTSWNWPARPGAARVDRVAVYRHTTRDDFARLLACDAFPYAVRAARAALVFWPKEMRLRWRSSRSGRAVREEHA